MTQSLYNTRIFFLLTLSFLNCALGTHLPSKLSTDWIGCRTLFIPRRIVFSIFSFFCCVYKTVKLYQDIQRAGNCGLNLLESSCAGGSSSACVLYFPKGKVFQWMDQIAVRPTVAIKLFNLLFLGCRPMYRLILLLFS